LFFVFFVFFGMGSFYVTQAALESTMQPRPASNTSPPASVSKRWDCSHMPPCLVYFFFWQYWGFNSGPSHWATPPVLFLWRVFWDKVLQNYPGWLQTAILLITAPWVARITGVSHQCLAPGLHF
jgi:hypothetical protein